MSRFDLLPQPTIGQKLTILVCPPTWPTGSNAEVCDVTCNGSIRSAPIIRNNNIKFTVSVPLMNHALIDLSMVGVSIIIIIISMIIIMLTYAREADSAVCLSKDSIVFDVWMIMDQSTLHVRLQRSLIVNDPQPPLVTGVTAGLVPQTR